MKSCKTDYCEAGSHFRCNTLSVNDLLDRLGFTATRTRRTRCNIEIVSTPVVVNFSLEKLVRIFWHVLIAMNLIFKFTISKMLLTFGRLQTTTNTPKRLSRTMSKQKNALLRFSNRTSECSACDDRSSMYSSSDRYSLISLSIREISTRFVLWNQFETRPALNEPSTLERRQKRC